LVNKENLKNHQFTCQNVNLILILDILLLYLQNNKDINQYKLFIIEQKIHVQEAKNRSLFARGIGRFRSSPE